MKVPLSIECIPRNNHSLKEEITHLTNDFTFWGEHSGSLLAQYKNNYIELQPVNCEVVVGGITINNTPKKTHNYNKVETEESYILSSKYKKFSSIIVKKQPQNKQSFE